ncbi:hypothetical protein Bbelb_065680 [Branchiostoma belcheri]|nr:hypothetical protein Bbelb_065680 [Branchiostoma belcheri]
MQYYVLLFVAASVVSAFFSAIPGSKNTTQPHIVFIVADDLGWNDVGWHNPDVKTPVLDQLAHDGVILNQTYVNYVCTPSRTAFMTGYFPYHVGMQHMAMLPAQPSAVPSHFPFLPEKLKELGYATHVVGKWHLGFCNWNYTPTYRGFDSFYGFYNGQDDYYKHTVQGGLDLRDDKEVVKTKDGEYSTSLTKASGY